MNATSRWPTVPPVAPQTVHDTAPALGWYSDHILFNRIWNRPGLVRRDRSIVTVTALIAGGHFAQLTGHLNRALNHGLTPDEIVELVTQLAFTCGWPNAMSAVKVVREVFPDREIPLERTAQPTGCAVVPDDSAASSTMAALVEEQVGQIVDGDVLLRPLLAARDRALATVTALVVAGPDAALPDAAAHALATGLTRAELAETVLHLSYYAGIHRARHAATILDGLFAR
jgi:4-carboxymuconolactone decarboxylase